MVYVARAEMKQQPRREGLIIVNPSCLRPDVLEPDLRNSPWQAVLCVCLIGIQILQITGHFYLGANVLVDLDGRKILQLEERRVFSEVIDVQIVADIGGWEKRHNLGGRRIDTALRDDIVREHVEHALAGRIEHRCAGIVDRVLNDCPAREVGAQIPIAGHEQVVAQIACPEFGVGHGEKPLIHCLPIAVILKTEEEERLVPAVVDLRDRHGTAERKAVVVQVLHHFDVVARAIVGERNAGVQESILEVLVDAAMV